MHKFDAYLVISPLVDEYHRDINKKILLVLLRKVLNRLGKARQNRQDFFISQWNALAGEPQPVALERVGGFFH